MKSIRPSSIGDGGLCGVEDGAAVKLIFLDVDGVLNCHYTEAAILGYIGIDSELVKRLKRIVDASDAKIMLISTWKEFLSEDCKEGAHIMGDYLLDRLRREHLCIYGKVDCNTFNRGSKIGEYLKEYLKDRKGIDGFVILDDTDSDYLESGVKDHHIQTDMHSVDGGLQEEHVERAICILNGGDLA